MRTLVCVMAMALAACGGAAVSFEDYEATERDAYCEYFVRCGAIEDLATCRKLELDLRTGFTANERAAVAAGKVDYDGDAARRCLAGLADRSCDLTSKSYRVSAAPCAEILTGTLHDGEACGYGGECISRQCEAAPCGMACCIGACVGDAPPGPAAIDESCEAAACGDDAYCDPDTKICVALKGRDQFCGSGAQCRYGLDCSQGGACTALPTLGQSCTGPCRDEGTICANGTCVKLALAGEACGPGAPCSRAYRCDSTRHCSPGLELGAECAVGQRCADDDAFCDVPDGAVSGHCALPKLDGQPCTNDPQCASDHCDPAAAQCAPAPVCI
jgi:hypothetical protein